MPRRRLSKVWRACPGPGGQTGEVGAGVVVGPATPPAAAGGRPGGRTAGAASPDRVLFVAYSKNLMTEEAWETQLSNVMDNVKSKFPSVKQIDLLGMVRAPNNQMCPNNNNPSTIVKPEQDQALQAVADKSAGAIKVGPKYFAPGCDSFVTNNTNLTAAAAAAIAPTLAAAYK